MPLQDLCLKHITNDFDKYYTIFSTTENAIIKRQFEFLQRKYSFQIASRLHAKKKLKEEYIDLLVNKHLKFIDINWFEDCSWITISSKFAEIGPNLVKIQFLDFDSIGDFSEGKPWHDIIFHLPNLEVLRFECEYFECPNKLLESVSKYCPNIVEINLRFSCLTNDGIKTLCLKEDGKVSCSKLKRLFVKGTNVSDDGMEHLLKNLPSLEWTDYKNVPPLLYKLHKDDLSSLDKVEPYKLISLSLLSYKLIKSPVFDDILKVCLSLCPNLKTLTCPLFKEEQLKLFSKLCCLEELHLVDYSKSAIDISNILKSKGSNLTSLTVLNCTVSVPVLAKNCTRLKTLNLHNVRFIVDDVSGHLFPCLDSCIFSNVIKDSSTDKAVKLLLSSASKLKSIAFKRCTLSPDMKTQLLKCCETYSIKCINFSYSTTDLSLLRDIILNCRSLKSLHLENCNIMKGDKLKLYRLSRGVPNNPTIDIDEDFSMESISLYRAFDELHDDSFLTTYYDYEDNSYFKYYDYVDHSWKSGCHCLQGDEDDSDDYECYFEL